MNQHAAADARPQGLFAWYAPGHSDQLGDRLRLFDNTDGPPLELLRLRPELAVSPDFERSLRARVAELQDFEDERYARVCRTDRLPEPGGGLAVVSVRTEGPRLSEMLRLAEERGARLPASLALTQIAGLVDAVAALHARGSSLAHGALGPERLVVMPEGRLRITEYVLGSALGSLRLERERAWRQFALALPPGPGPAPFDQRTDVVQVATVALALVLSRVLGPEDYPGGLHALLVEAGRRSAEGGWDRAWPALRPWLRRALALDAGGFADALEARDGLVAIVGAPARPLPERGTFKGREAPVRGADESAILALDDREQSFADEDRPRPAPGVAVDAPEDAARREPTARGGRFAGWRALGTWPGTRAIVLAALLVLAIAEGMYIASRVISASASAARSSTGTAHIVSTPAGAEVAVDGRAAGRTPISLALAAGRHVVALSAGARRRTVNVESKAGETTSLVVELGPDVAAAGQLRVSTAPPGARVSVDGQPRGTSPVLVADLAPGEHEVLVEGRGRSVRQTVGVEGGVTAALLLPLPNPEAPAPGWLSITSPEELQVVNEGALLGTSRSPRIMLPAGRHELDLVNEELGVRTTEEVVVPVGRTATLEVALPTARVDINATPWAEVWVDGSRVGETPLSGVPVAVGRHVVTFRHPGLGERRVETVVSLKQPTRLGVDLRK